MKIYRALFSPFVGSLLATLAAGMLWSANASAQAAGTWNTALVPISGTVTGSPESVSFSGQARVESKLAPDPDFNRPSFVLNIDLSSVSGVGRSSEKKYVIQGPERTQRAVASSHLIEFTFPFVKSTESPSSARAGVATFNLIFDTATGAVTAATANINPPQ